MCSMNRLKKETTHPGGKMTCQRMVSVSLIFGAESSALVIVTQILPAKSNLSSVFEQDETYVPLGTGHTSLSQMSSKVIKVQITGCFICTLGIK
jgi:hypothetical protein